MTSLLCTSDAASKFVKHLKESPSRDAIHRHRRMCRICGRVHKTPRETANVQPDRAIYANLRGKRGAFSGIVIAHEHRMPAPVAPLATTVSSARRNACDALRFAAGMTMLAAVFVTVQTLLFVEERLALLTVRAANAPATVPR